MRLVPRSLFGRLVLVLLAGLAVAQLATAYLNASERDRLLYQAGGMQLAQRIGDIARLLDSVAPDERRRIARVFDAPPLRVSLDRPALAARDSGAGVDMAQSMLARVLRFQLGDSMPVAVVRSAHAPEPWSAPRRYAPGMGSMMEQMMEPPRYRPVPRGGLFYVVQVTLHDGSRVTFDSYLSPQEASMPLRLALTLLILVGTVVVLALIAVRWLTVPLRSLATAAEELGRDIDRPPLDETGPLEVRRAAHAFNTMQQRLARFIADRTRVLAAISHDLKTPITRLRLRSEMLEDETLRTKIVKDLDEMQSMVTQALDYMRDTGRREASQALDLMALLESLQADYHDTGRPIAVEGRIARPIRARPLALRRCLANLIDNALRYGGSATIKVEERAGEVSLHVLDEGPGMPESELEQAFEPFHRGEASRSRETGGSGLGLGIARNIARAHGGDVVLRNRPDRGLDAVVTLPRQQGD